MFLRNNFKSFDDTLLERHPDLKKSLKPNDYYIELERIMKLKSVNLPAGSLNTKIIINHGKVVERVFKTPKGRVVSLFSNPSNVSTDQVA
tara:strand:+ start:217 stop:486 length:270 start_codon:yes stop_codon:yes gene_type:complete